jgi:hypothetical protein
MQASKAPSTTTVATRKPLCMNLFDMTMLAAALLTRLPVFLSLSAAGG